MEHRRRTKRVVVDEPGTAGGPSGARVFRRESEGGVGSELSNRRSLSRLPQHTGGNYRRDGQADDSQQGESVLRTTERSGPVTSANHRRTKGSGGGTFDKHSKQIIDGLTAGVILLDRSLLIVGINPAAENILGISESRSQGESLLRLIGEDPELQDVLSRVITTGDHYASELKLAPTEVQAHERIVDCRVSPLDLEPVALLVEMTDVTRRIQISRENALLIQHGAGRQMIRQLAHEIKNPLGGIRGAAQLLERELSEDDLKEYTDVIISETDRLAGLVDTLLGPGGPSNKQPVNVHELLEYVVRIVDAEGLPSLRIQRDYDPGLPEIDLDSDQMVQAFLNLVRNASVALGGQGTITLRSRAVTNFTIGAERHRVIASIEIEDDGPGIPAELQDSVFYPLVTSRPDGTGLGLPAAQELISRHGGLIEFESRPGRTVFFVRIPLDQKTST
jgi:two-component system nitrogen regulation sensor histidine kinase GlnL